MEIDEIKKEGLRSIEEFDKAWIEFFKDKPEPNNDEEDRKQQEDFYHWYNYVRKQSDTGKTPSEMYKDSYGKEPPKDFPKTQIEPSRIINFEWDEDSNEYAFDEDEKEDEGILKEVSEIADTMFDNEIWANAKEEVKELSRKETSKHMFKLGFFIHAKYTDYQIRELTEKMKDMTKEEIDTMITTMKKDKEDKNG